MDALDNADVSELTTVANKFYDEAQAATVGMLESAWKSGQALVKIKATLKHGEWMPWVKSNFHGSHITANEYMMLANSWSTMNLAGCASIGAALKAIRAENAKRKPRNTKTKTEREPVAFKRHERHDQVVELFDQGKTVAEIAEQTGMGTREKPGRQIRHILDREKIERQVKAESAEVAAPEWNSIPEPARVKLERAKVSIRKEAEREFVSEANRYKAECDAALARYKSEYKSELDAEYKRLYDLRKEDYRRYREVIEAQRASGVMSLRDYNIILSCLHPDSRISTSDEKLAAAFRLFNDPKVKVLLAKEDSSK